MRVWPGRPYPLGATWDGRGTNFAVTSVNGATVALVLFDSPSAAMESVCVRLDERTDAVWHVYLPDIRPGQLYGYRVDGPWQPEHGARFSPTKVLLDPYAKAIGRPLVRNSSLLAYRAGSDGRDADTTDSAPYAPLGAVVDPAFDWRDDHPPTTPWHETVIYELHVKGFTALHRRVPPDLRGTYLGLASPAAIRHLLDLGVTAVELMPVHGHADEISLLERGLTNYWGYNSLAYFAPDARFAATSTPLDVVSQFKTMVRTLHASGLEVILDVVYNHTAEGNHLGPTLSFRGLDNATYYRLDPSDHSHYQDFTGCGNTLNMQSPDVLKLLMDSLRYWVLEMHVDGFRFDLASALARELFAVDRLSSFFDVIHQDPVISRVKLIAEPWDVGEGGYQVGNFPPGWAEWNGRYRDAVRRFWRGDAGMLPEFTTRLAGSSDLYGASGRHPHASINFVTAHDGFTLVDLVSYEERHNEANGEANRDGASDNFSWNEGIEGPTDDAPIRERRARQQRNLLFTLLMSVGVPMISGGDEVGRTQLGNNNAYCHDSTLSWTPWEDGADASLLAFARALVAFRQSQPVLMRRTFLGGRRHSAADVLWLRPDGREMTDADWAEQDRRVIQVQLDGSAIPETDAHGDRIVGDTVLLVFNGESGDVDVTLPAREGPTSRWERVLDTSRPDGPAHVLVGGSRWTMTGKSAAAFRLGR
ncbi:MAG TPA: glycogen debranching protein GlgX [Vicinamibacterales bacterium]